MPKLTDTFINSDEYPQIPPKFQAIYAEMCNIFAAKPEYLSFTPHELSTKIQGTPPDLWQDFLNLNTIQLYIKQQLQNNAQVAFRKAHQALTQAAQSGNVQAAKQITEISQVLNTEQSNRQVVLTYVPREIAKEKIITDEIDPTDTEQADPS